MSVTYVQFTSCWCTLTEWDYNTHDCAVSEMRVSSGGKACNTPEQVNPHDARLAALREVLAKAQNAEAVHHNYADSYEEGKRDMADQFCQAIEALIKREEEE